MPACGEVSEKSERGFIVNCKKYGKYSKFTDKAVTSHCFILLIVSSVPIPCICMWWRWKSSSGTTVPEMFDVQLSVVMLINSAVAVLDSVSSLNKCAIPTQSKGPQFHKSFCWTELQRTSCLLQAAYNSTLAEWIWAWSVTHILF
jgi:hypothetical protein